MRVTLETMSLSLLALYVIDPQPHIGYQFECCMSKSLLIALGDLPGKY
jgi:hypothetical protein